VIEGAFGRLSNALRIAWLISRQVATSLWQNWGIALLSVVLAISLWVYVTNKNDTKQTGRLAGSVAVKCVNVPLGEADSPPCTDQSVTVRVRAPQSTIDHLTANDCSATADASAVSSADASAVPVRVECPQAGVEVLDWAPAQIRVTLENVTSRTVAVRSQLVGAPPRGFQAQQIALQPQEVVVSGPASLVGRVASVEADLDLTGVRTNLEQTVLLKARDEQGGDVQGVNVEPKSAQARVTMVQLEFSAVFVVEPEISGTPAPGFSAAGVQIDPPFVTISGPAEVFQSLDPAKGIATEPVSIDGASADVVRTVALRLPQGARVEQPGVTVRVIVTRATTATATPAGGSP
jgi:YbbR domain-containing protein